jgi:hypothetical protein
MGTSSSKPENNKDNKDNKDNKEKISFKLSHPTKTSPSNALKEINEKLPYFMTIDRRDIVKKETQDWLKEYKFMRLKPTNKEDEESLKELYLISSLELKENYENKDKNKLIKANCNEILLIEEYTKKEDENFKNIFLIVSLSVLGFWAAVLVGYIIYKKVYEKTK